MEERAGREGKKRVGEVDSDAQLEQGRQLAKVGTAPSVCSVGTKISASHSPITLHPHRLT